MATPAAPPPPPASLQLPPLFSAPSSSSCSSITPAPTLLTQGAEALVYKTVFLTPSRPAALKFRPSKPYRHPVLDKRLTRQRILAEARVLVRLRREGVCVPAVWGADWDGMLISCLCFSGGREFWRVLVWIDELILFDYLQTAGSSSNGSPATRSAPV